MGSIARMSRAQRFIEEFGKDLKIPMENLLVKSIELAQEEGGGECVRFFVTLRDKRTDDELSFMSEYVFFDPELDVDDIAIDRVRGWIEDIGEEEVMERMKKAKLV